MKSKIKAFFCFGIAGLSVLTIAHTMNVDANNGTEVLNKIMGPSSFKVFDSNPKLIDYGNVSYMKENGVVSFKSKVQYKVDGSYITFSLLDSRYYDFEEKNFLDNKSAYFVTYVCESPFEGDEFSLGFSQGTQSSGFATSFSIDDSYELSDSLTFTESVETEAFGNKIAAGIKQSVGASVSQGTANGVQFSFSYDKIKDNKTVHSATMTTEDYMFVERAFIPSRYYASILARVLNKYTIRYTEIDRVYLYKSFTKKIEVM